MDYIKRIDRLRLELDNRNLDGIFISPDANWEYIAGVPRIYPGNTKQRQNSLEYAGMLVTDKDVVVFLPRLTSLGILGRIRDFSWITKIVIFEDQDLIGKAFIDTCRDLKLNNKRVGVIQDVSSSLVLKLSEELDISFVNADYIIQNMRCRKDAEEIGLMREASGIADKIFDGIVPQLKEGVSIREIEIEIDRLGEKYGASMSSFPTTVLNHGKKSGNSIGDNYPVIEKGHMIAFDYGVIYKGYCSDFGRTVFIGDPEDDLIKIHELMMSAQQEGINLLKAKCCTGQSVNAGARKVIEDAGYGKYFIHRLGHGIGMDVHERPFLAEGEERTIEEGMTFTVEPSIFIPGRCLVRVEDIVLVTEDEPEVLNKVSKNLHIVA